MQGLASSTAQNSPSNKKSCNFCQIMLYLKMENICENGGCGFEKDNGCFSGFNACYGGFDLMCGNRIG